MGILSILGGVIGLGNSLTGIADKIADAYKAREAAKTDREKLAIDERIKTLELQRDVLVSEQGSRLTNWVRPAFAFPFVVYLWKLILWDKVLGLGATDPLSDQLSEILMIVIGAFFLTRPFEKVGQAWAARKRS